MTAPVSGGGLARCSRERRPHRARYLFWRSTPTPCCLPMPPNGKTDDVSSRLQARNEAAAYRIGNDSENDGDGACLLQQRRGDSCALRKNEVGLQRGEFL